MEWKKLEDRFGNPMLKFNDYTNRQMTIHYDKMGNITASHIKNPDGTKQFINPSDAFIGAELIKRWK